MRILRDRSATFDLDGFLRLPLMAHLAIKTSTGATDTPIWFHWDGHEVWFISVTSSDSFPRKLRACPECAIGVVQYDDKTGIVRHVGFRGLVEHVLFSEAIALALFEKYLGRDRENWDRRFLQALKVPNRMMMKLFPSSVVIRDQSYSPARDHAPAGPLEYGYRGFQT